MADNISSPEGWRASPIWLRVMLVALVFIIIATVIVIVTTIPAPYRVVQIVGAPQADFITFVEAYRSRGTIFSSRADIASAERICIGMNPTALGEGVTDFTAEASFHVEIFLNEQAVLAEDMVFQYDPDVVVLVDENGQEIGTQNGTLSVCFRTDELPAGDYIGLLAVTDTAGVVRRYDWAFRLG